MGLLKNNEDLNKIYENFMEDFNNDELLKTHRFYIEKNNLGYGERPFHVLWKELVKLQEKEFKFLEIGVYKGQVLSLVKLLSDFYDKKIEFYGVAPFDESGDGFSVYEKTDYKKIITDLFLHFNLDFEPNKNLIEGSSTDESVKDKVKKLKYFDLIYIDGCHDYNCVVSDIKLTKNILKIGGFVVLDDASCFKNISNKFKGHIDVCNAIKDVLENDSDFDEITSIGHNRVFKKIK